MKEPGGPSLGGNYELQQQYLNDKQRDISWKLFESGVASRIAQAVQANDAKDLQNLAQLDVLFVPALGTVVDAGYKERELSLAAITQKDDGTSNYSYLKLGRVDTAGIVYPYPNGNVTSEDADAVWRHAAELLADKDAGVMPNLAPNLLFIENPNTIMTVYDLPDK